MDSIKIKKRTKKVRDSIKSEWHERWWQFIIDNQDKDMCWYSISSNPNIIMKNIIDNPVF